MKARGFTATRKSKFPSCFKFLNVLLPLGSTELIAGISIPVFSKFSLSLYSNYDIKNPLGCTCDFLPHLSMAKLLHSLGGFRSYKKRQLHERREKKHPAQAIVSNGLISVLSAVCCLSPFPKAQIKL